MSQATEVRLRNIRAHEGSQARAWEELAYQLRPSPGPQHIETRKTRAPDAGVEWYDVYADGHQEGFQAKFHASLEDALSGMLESVKAVATKRPNMSKLTFVVPYDFTDSGTSTTKTDQDRWDDAVSRWNEDIPGAERLSFSIIKAGDITDKLTLAENAGRRAYWFGNFELTDRWLSARLDESIAVAGQRYTPKADTPSAINALIEATSKSRRYMSDLESKVRELLRACRQDTGMWDQNADAVREKLQDLDNWAVLAFGHPIEAELCELPNQDPDFRVLSNIVAFLHDAARAGLEKLETFERRNIDRALTSIDALHGRAFDTPASLCSRRAMAIEGPAGQGKTHALMATAERLLEDGVPVIAILGQRLRDATWWSAFSDSLGGLPWSSDEFLQALDSLAEARNCRGVIIVDALNESEAPQRWKTELPALLVQVRAHANLALIVSYRNDYRDVITPPPELPRLRHPGLAGREVDALEKYCALFGIAVPSQSLFDSSLEHPLFLRMYCEVLARESRTHPAPISRSNLFERFAAVRSRQVIANLELAPSSDAVNQAMVLISDLLLANRGQAVPRAKAESAVDSLLPARPWPRTLFQQMCSEGLIELRPTFDGTQSVGLPFQAYSEHLLASRLLDTLGLPQPRRWWHWLRPNLSNPQTQLTTRLINEPWLWRAMAVLLPERWELELPDLIPEKRYEYKLRSVLWQSFAERTPAAFGQRAFELLDESLAGDDGSEAVDTVLSLAPRELHPANADWLHQRLIGETMPTRDRSWSINSYEVQTNSPAFRRLSEWALRVSTLTSDEEIRLAAIAFMWLLSSPNRFLRDGVTKTLAQLLSVRLAVAAQLLHMGQAVDDLYVQERVLASTYGAVMVGGDKDHDGVGLVCNALEQWQRSGLPVHVLARDSARGILAWAHSRGLASDEVCDRFSPPYGAEAPTNPPTAEELRASHGYVKNDAGDIVEWRAFSILDSCLDWYGDFNKYVVKGDVNHFSLYPLDGPPPIQRRCGDDQGEFDGDWAGRWIATRAIEMGWTAERFERFERGHDFRSGRDSHKPERFGKKYQWIALHELLARLADNYHPSLQPWESQIGRYEGPWPWYGRDIDPSLPPSRARGDANVCQITLERHDTFAMLASPDLDSPMAPDEWVARAHDLPNINAMFTASDSAGRKWVALQRYSTWDRDNARRKGLTKRERDVFFLQFSWLTQRGQGTVLLDLLKERGLNGRWMPEARRIHTQYLGELGWAPVQSTNQVERETPEQLIAAGIDACPAVEQYLWEGSTLDCSLDESVDFYMPTTKLLGNARWVGHRAEWAVGHSVISKALHIEDGENGQDVLLADADWLNQRLIELNADLVIGTLSEKHALRSEDNDRRMAFSDISYLALIRAGQAAKYVGPALSVRQTDQPIRSRAAEPDVSYIPEEYRPTPIDTQPPPTGEA